MSSDESSPPFVRDVYPPSRTGVVVVASRDDRARWELCAGLSDTGHFAVMAANIEQLDTWLRTQDVRLVVLDLDFVAGVASLTARLTARGVRVLVRGGPEGDVTSEVAAKWGAFGAVAHGASLDVLTRLIAS